MFMNTWAKRIHENAVAHGWWENERSFAEVAALFHSEVSEALEEYRAKRPLLWFEETNGFKVTDMNERRGEKPEGIAVELVDCVIRILDYFGHEGIAEKEKADAQGIDIDGMIAGGEDWCAGLNMAAELPEAVANLHFLISLAYEAHMNTDHSPEQVAEYERNGYLCAVIDYIRTWLANNGCNMEEIMVIKHEYNRTRSYRHGGKAL